MNNVFASQTAVSVGNIVSTTSHLLIDTFPNDAERRVDELNLAITALEENSTPQHLDAATKLAYNLIKTNCGDHILVDRIRNEVVRGSANSGKKTIYRILSPEAINLRPPLSHSAVSSSNESFSKPKNNLGRPKKRTLTSTESSLPSNAPKKPMPSVEESPDQHSSNEQQRRHVYRTRAGRLTRAVARLSSMPTSPAEDDSAYGSEIDSMQRNLLSELKDCDFRVRKTCAQLISSTSPAAEKEEPPASDKKRCVPANSICPTCKKIFLGRRLQRHFSQHPDHMQLNVVTPPPQSSTPNDEMTLFRFLIQKLKKSSLNEDQRADLFLHELNDLVEQLQLRSSRLIRNTSGLHFVSARTSRVLGIPEGQYALDLTAIETPPEPDVTVNCAVQSLSSRSMDYTALSMSLDDTLTDEAAQKLNLSAGGKLLPPSEESLLRSVGDLVHDSMKKLRESESLHPPVETSTACSTALVVPHYDNVSDNAVEAMSMKETSVVQQTPPLLDLAVDFFQFNKN